MSIIPQGFALGTSVEVEVATRAQRTVQRPIDFSRNSSNLLAQYSPIAGSQAANQPYFSMIYGGDYLALVRSIRIGITQSSAFTPGAFTIQLFFARFANVAATTGASMQQGLTNPFDGKLRTRMRRNDFGGVSLNPAAQMVIATATVPLATPPNVDANPLASITVGAPTVPAIQELIPHGTKLWHAKPGEHPIVLGMQDGLVIKATPPATGIWNLNINLRWDEVPAY